MNSLFLVVIWLFSNEIDDVLVLLRELKLRLTDFDFPVVF